MLNFSQLISLATSEECVATRHDSSKTEELDCLWIFIWSCESPCLGMLYYALIVKVVEFEVCSTLTGVFIDVCQILA